MPRPVCDQLRYKSILIVYTVFARITWPIRTANLLVWLSSLQSYAALCHFSRQLSQCCHTQRTNFPDRCALLVFIGVSHNSASPGPRTLIKSLKIEAQALESDCPCRVTSEWRRVLLLYMVRHTCGMTKPQREPHRYQPIDHGYGLVGLVVRKYLALREQSAAGI